VIAHELGHHVQQELGIEQKVRQESQANPDDATSCRFASSCRPTASPGSGPARPTTAASSRAATSGGPRPPRRPSATTASSSRRREDRPESFTHGPRSSATTGSRRASTRASSKPATPSRARSSARL
jgi:hypothetical protein